MGRIIYGLNTTLDGVVDHDAEGVAPDAVLFRHFIDRTRRAAGLIYGRGLYEVMRYWDQDNADWSADHRAYAEAWRGQRKWVFSRSLKDVGPNAAFVDEELAGFVARMRAEAEGDFDFGGPHLANALAGRGLIDEYQLYVHPVTAGQGRPFFVGGAPPLKLARHETIGNAVRLSYVPA